MIEECTYTWKGEPVDGLIDNLYLAALIYSGVSIYCRRQSCMGLWFDWTKLCHKHGGLMNEECGICTTLTSEMLLEALNNECYCLEDILHLVENRYTSEAVEVIKKTWEIALEIGRDDGYDAGYEDGLWASGGYE